MQAGPRGGERRAPRTVRACGRGALVAPWLRRGLAACRARSQPPALQPPSPAAGQRRQAGLSGRLRGRRRALSRSPAALPRLQLPVAQTASENAPRSVQGLHFVACGLAASPLGHVVIGRAGGGARKRERERASRTAPLPARILQPQPGREREPRGGPTTKAARPLRQPTTAPRTMPAWPGARRFWRPEGFQTQEAFGAVEGHT